MTGFDKKIKLLNEKYTKLWEEVCNIESPTKYKEGVDKVGACFIKKAEELGFETEIFRQEAAGDVVCIKMNSASSLKPVVISGHIDTVHPVGSFGEPPVRTDGEKIYGPGVVDCKGGVVAGLMAMELLRDCGFSKRPVMLLIQTDEETGSSTSCGETIKYICEKSLDAVIFLNLEGYAAGKATLWRKGIASYRFDVEGIEGHSSRCVTEGANAIVDAANKIIELDKLKDDDGITCNCAIVSGGTVLNTIPGRCSFSVNFRYATNEQAEWIENYVRTLAATVHVPGCKCTVCKITARPAMEKTEKNFKTLERVNEIFAGYGIPLLEARMRHGGSDAAYATQYGIPCLDSLGVEGGDIHSVREYALLSSLGDAAKRIAAIAVEI